MKIFEKFDLTSYNSYKVFSECKRAYFPETEDDVIEFFKKKEPYILLGSGHNIILSREYYDIDFIIFNGNFDDIQINQQNGIVEAESGAAMLDLANASLQNSLSGIEVFYDIPSSLGGAVVMNAGASGDEIKDVLLKIRYLDLNTLEVTEVENSETLFEYRNSYFQKNTDKIILKAWLQLKHADSNIIKEKMESVKAGRWAKQPKEFPSAGSVFKRPEGKFVGPMIESLGLKGYSVGGAQISTKHAGFIINYGNATGKDIMELIDYVKARVFEKYSITLEVEQRII